MKAILVIDIDEIENCDAEVFVYKNDIPYQSFSRIKLKPMPKKKNPLDDCGMFHGKGIEGYNACIDEILGE